MGGTAPVCPFCHKWCNAGGVKDHVRAKHPDKYAEWVRDGQLPYWMYDAGMLKELTGAQRPQEPRSQPSDSQ